MSKRDFYEILGIDKNATPDQIKKAYRKVAKENHPDINQGDKEAEEKFKEAAEAYEVLSDVNRRKNYDTYGHNASKGGGMNMDDIFSQFGDIFGRQRVAKGETMNLVVKMTMEEIYTGFEKRFKYNRNTKCNTCTGRGGTGSKSCTSCSGTGTKVEHIQTPIGVFNSSSPCTDCSGTGTTYETECTDCKGAGVTMIEDFVDITIPAGVIDGMVMVLPEKGQAIKNGVTGDLVIRIMEEPHAIFKRNGNDVKMVLKLQYHQLILGDKVEITTIDGGKIRVDIPELAKIGHIFRVQKKGLPQMNTDVRGDMLLEVGILVPDKIDADERSLVEQLKKLKENVASV